MKSLSPHVPSPCNPVQYQVDNNPLHLFLASVAVFSDRQLIFGCWRPTLYTKKPPRKSTYLILSLNIKYNYQCLINAFYRETSEYPNTHFPAFFLYQKAKKWINSETENIWTFSGCWLWCPVLIVSPLSPQCIYPPRGWRRGKVWGEEGEKAQVMGKKFQL